MISMIVAHDLNRAIGRGNTLPWHIKEDSRYFSKITKGSTVVMGEKTYRSIGKPLPYRVNIVLSRNKDLKIEGVTVVNNIEWILQLSETTEVFVIGGEQIYKTFLPHAQILYITLIDLHVEDADTYFPSYEEDFEQLICGQKNYSEEQDCLYSFNLWKRKK